MPVTAYRARRSFIRPGCPRPRGALLGALAVIGLAGQLAGATSAWAGEPFQTDARVRAGDVVVQDATGRWIRAGSAGSSPAAPVMPSQGTNLARPPVMEPASVGSPVTARAFAQAQGLTYVDYGSHAILEDGALRVHVYANSNQGLVASRSMQFKEPVARRGDELMLPARVVRLLERETGVERARIAQEGRELARREAALRALIVDPPTPPTRLPEASPTPKPSRLRPVATAVSPTRRTSARALAGWVPPRNAPQREWKWIVLHHSDDLSGNAAKYDRIHRHDNGWEHGLGYHFVIGNGSLSNDGQVEIGPRWEQQLHGAHAKTPDNRFNDHGVGICMVGNFDAAGGRPTAAQMESLVRLTRWLMQTYGIAADHVRGHCDCCATKCPGENFPWDEFRARLR